MKKPGLSLALGAVLFSGCHPKPPPSAETAPRVEGEKLVLDAHSTQLSSLTIEPVQRCTSTPARLNGRLAWNDERTVRIFSPFAGQVTHIAARAGQVVSEAETLATIASPDFGQAQAEQRKAAGDLILAERTLARARELFAHGAAPKKDLESAEADYARTLAEKNRASSRLALYGNTAEQPVDHIFQLKSPLAGTIVELNVNPGQEVRPDQMLANSPQLCSPLFVVSEPTQLWIYLDVTEENLPKIKPGEYLAVHSRAFPSLVFDGKVENISDSFDPITRTVKVRGVVRNPSKLLKAEMFVTADLAGEGQPGVDVPVKAVFLRDNKHYLFLEQAPGAFVRQPVTVGAEHEGKLPVPEGLAPGQKVVSEGCLLLEALLEAGDKS